MRGQPATLAVLCLAVLGTLPGCSSDPAGVASASEVQIRFQISGGIAGIGYALLVDGRSGSVLGESCVNGCSFDPGQTVLGVTEQQIQSWVDLLVGGGILALDGTDYGSECCDRFHVELTYSDGSSQSTVRGNADLMPPEVQAVVYELSGLVTESLAVVIDPSLELASLPADPVEILEVTLSGSTLSLVVEYGGGCTHHALGLFGASEWLESFPVQTPLQLAHDDRDDMCDALVRRTLHFRLGPLERAYLELYPGGTPGDRQVRLNIASPPSGGVSVLHTF